MKIHAWAFVLLSLAATVHAAIAASPKDSTHSSGSGIVATAKPAKGGPVRKAVIVSINDVYQIEGTAEGQIGGMGRVRTLRAELEKSSPDLIFLHAGDFLGPSFLSRTYYGAQMIDVMNIMDGNPNASGFDTRMFVTFGNHEFDATNCGREGPLAKLVANSKFTWLASNLAFEKCDPLRDLAREPKVLKRKIIESGGLKIGLFGLTVAYPDYKQIVRDPLATGCEETAQLRKDGADVVVALTHLNWMTDLELLGRDANGNEIPADKRSCKVAPDLVVGGHDHKSMALPVTSPRLFKADAEAETAWVIEIEKVKGALQIKGRLEPLDQRRTPDPLVQRIVGLWLRSHDERFCLADCMKMTNFKSKMTCMKTVEGGACLKEPFARTASLLEAEEIANRSFETGFGDWVADRVREAGSADVAFLNSGAIRINQNLPAGTLLLRRHLEQMFPFPSKLVTRDVPGKQLWNAMEHAVEKRGDGAWAHFSGMAVKLADPGSTRKVERILVKRRDGSIIEIGPETDETIKVASLAFVFANGDHHGFDLCNGQPLPACVEALDASPNWPLTDEGADISSLMRMKLREVDQAKGLVLEVDRRLCDRGQTDCLISKWQK